MFYQVSTLKRFDICESETAEKDLITALKSMPHSRSPGHDGLTKRFYEQFLNDLKVSSINSSKQSKIDNRLPIARKQTIINLLVKKDRDKRFVKNWPVSLLNVGIKILFESLAEKLQLALSKLLSSNQTSYVKN